MGMRAFSNYLQYETRGYDTNGPVDNLYNPGWIVGKK